MASVTMRMHENDMSAGTEYSRRFHAQGSLPLSADACACACAKPQLNPKASIYMASQYSTVSTGLHPSLQVIHQIHTSHCRNNLLPLQSSRQGPTEAINTRQTAIFSAAAAPAKDRLKAQ